MTWWSVCLWAGGLGVGDPQAPSSFWEQAIHLGQLQLAWLDDDEKQKEKADDDDDEDEDGDEDDAKEDDDDEEDEAKEDDDDDDDRPGPPGRRGGRDRRGHRPPPRPGVDVEFDIDMHGPPPPPMRPEDRLFRDGDFWILEASAIRMKATGPEKPFDPAGPIVLKLADGGEIEIVPSRFPGPPPGGPPHGGPGGMRRPGPPGGPPHGRGPFGPPSAGGPPGPPPGISRSLHDELRPTPPGEEMEAMGKKEMEIDREIRELRGLFGRAATTEKESLRQRITEKVKEQFQSRQDLRRAVLERIKQDLDRLDSSIKKREEGRDGLIDRRVQEILGDGAVDF